MPLGLPVLTFIVPVRHQQNARDWTELKSHLAQTLRSLAAQTAANWHAVVIANHGADLPALPAGVVVVRVDFPPNPLHERGTADEETFYEAVRLDKGTPYSLRRVCLRHASCVANRLVTGMWFTRGHRLRPQEDDLRCVHICIGLMTATDARETRTLPTCLRDVTTHGTRLRLSLIHI